MMKNSFDLISDLHVDTWDKQFSWTNMPTSMFCVVAGDISRDRTQTINTLHQLGQIYKRVLYIDGNDEHRWSFDDLRTSYDSLKNQIANIENVVYLRDTVAVIDGVAFIGVCGWWDFEFRDSLIRAKTIEWFCKQYKVTWEAAENIRRQCNADSLYLNRAVEDLQTQKDIDEIVIVSHTVPAVGLVEHDAQLPDIKMNCLGSNKLLSCLVHDTECKISTWCFGHYHNDVDQVHNGVRFVNNCKGRNNTEWSKSVYFPKKIIL